MITNGIDYEYSYISRLVPRYSNLKLNLRRFVVNN